jgi:hypothetical protein
MSPSRTLPDEQKQVDPDVDDRETQLQTLEQAEHLSEHFDEIKTRTTENGDVEGVVKAINMATTNGTVAVEIDIPGRENNKTVNFEKPRSWTEQYDFVRWIRHYGYTADTIPNMLENDCRVAVNVEDGSYSLYVPPQSRRDRIRGVGRRANSILPDIGALLKRYAESDVWLWPLLAGLWLLGVIAAGTDLLLLFPMSTLQRVGLWLIFVLLIPAVGVLEVATKGSISKP